MQVDSPQDFLQRNGRAYKVRGKELVTDCPQCGKEAHCFINATTWQWHCKRCDARGNEVTFKKALGLQWPVQDTQGRDPEQVAVQRFAKELQAVAEATQVERWTMALADRKEAAAARAYLQQRGIPLEAAVRYRLGWAALPDGTIEQGSPRARRAVPGAESVEPAGPGWIVIPACTRQGADGRPDPASCAMVKLRSVPPAERDFRRLVGGESVIYAPCGINPAQPLLVVGGELDALSCAVAGWSNVISTTVGESAWDDAWTPQLEACEDLVICYDTDEAGQKGAQALAEKLGAHRVRLGTWGQWKDANEALQAGALDPAAVVQASRPAGGDAIIRVDSIREKYKRGLLQEQPRGLSTGWADLDALIGGVRWGEVTVTTGDTASGKSTFVSQWALHMASQGIRCLVCPFELGVTRQLDKWVRQWAQAPPDTLAEQKLDKALDDLTALPIWLLNRHGSIKLEPMRNTLLYAIRRLGVRFVLLDHLHYMVEEGPREREELDGMMKMCADVALTTQAHVVLVAHPRQNAATDEKHRDNRIVQLSDLKGTSGLKQVADNVLSVWRPRLADRTGGTTDKGDGLANVYALKARSDYGAEGAVAFKFLFDSARFEAPDMQLGAALKEAIGTAAGAQAVDDDENRPRRRRVPAVPEKRVADRPLTKHWTEVNDD